MKVSREVERKILAMAGEPASPQRGVVAPKPVGPARLTLVVWIPGLLPRNESNTRGKARAYIARKTATKEAVRAALEGVPVLGWPRPVPVTLVRVGGRRMDTHENLPVSMKAVADAVCEWLGCDDGDAAAVRIRSRQRAGYESGTEIRVG